MNEYLSKWCCLIIFNNRYSNTAHLVSTLTAINCTKHLYYYKDVDAKDEWGNEPIERYLQLGKDSGTQMKTAFENAFAKGFRKVVLIKSNFDQIQSQQIIEAFNCLKMIEFCIGPKDNGDYYLIGMNYFEPRLFNNKQWDSPTLLKETIKDIGNLKQALYKLATLKNKEYAASINP